MIRTFLPIAARRLGFAGHPRGLPSLFMTELWERFSYYGMRALLVLYMTAPALDGGLAWQTSGAGLVYGNYTMAIYLLAIPGGYIADTMLGPRRAILAGGSMIAAGHFSLAIPSLSSFYLGLVLIALGTGLFKPSISASVGALYAKGDARRDAGFSIFYMGINIGAFLAPLVTGFLAQSTWFKAQLAANGFDPALSWHWGFAAAGMGMLLALASFTSQPAPEIPANRAGATSGPGTDQDMAPQWTPRAAALVAAGTVGLLGLLVLSDQPAYQWLRSIFVVAPVAAIAWFARAQDLEKQRVAAAAVFFIASMLFWAVFEQAGTSITLFADQLTDNRLFGQPFPSAWYQALNPLFVIALAPVLASIWLRLGPSQPSAGIKFAIGLAFLAASLLLMVPAAYLTGSGKISPWWLVGLFLLQTVGELCVSPVGLSIMTKLAPPGRTAIMLGIWFLAASWGGKLAGIMGSHFSVGDTAALAWFFLGQFMILAIAIAILVALTPWLKRRMLGVD